MRLTCVMIMADSRLSLNQQFFIQDRTAFKTRKAMLNKQLRIPMCWPNVLERLYIALHAQTTNNKTEWKETTLCKEKEGFDNQGVLMNQPVTSGATL